MYLLLVDNVDIVETDIEVVKIMQQQNRVGNSAQLVSFQQQRVQILFGTEKGTWDGSIEEDGKLQLSCIKRSRIIDFVTK